MNPSMNKLLLIEPKFMLFKKNSKSKLEKLKKTPS